MAYKALYREWRPQVFEDVIGQEHIVKTLRNQVISGRIPHAYLLCGTRGTGKTTSAKILSKAVNCLNPKDGDPCNECEICKEINLGTCIDVIEMDAASYTGVDNIRELIDNVRHSPHMARHKVYIIDEVHMLSTSAFNALLKTLEEPPSYVIFILATTDPQKVPPTILSRCQRYDFKRIKVEDISVRLREITDKNGIYVEDRTLDTISRVSDGALRDAVSILDQAISMSSNKIEYEEVIVMLGLASNEYIFELTNKMIDKDVEGSVKIVDDIILSGKDVLQFIKDMTKHFRNVLMAKISKHPEGVIDLAESTIKKVKEQAEKMHSDEIMRAIKIMTDAENEAKYTSQPRILLEIAVIKYCKREYDTTIETLLARVNRLERDIKNGAIAVTPVQTMQPQNSNAKQAVKAIPSVDKQKLQKVYEEDETADYAAGDLNIEEVKAKWHDALHLIKGNKRTAEVLLALGYISEVKKNRIVIEFEEQNAFSKIKLENSSEDRELIAECFSKILNTKVRIEFKIKEVDKLGETIRRVKDVLGEDIVEVIE